MEIVYSAVGFGWSVMSAISASSNQSNQKNYEAMPVEQSPHRDVGRNTSGRWSFDLKSPKQKGRLWGRL